MAPAKRGRGHLDGFPAQPELKTERVSLNVRHKSSVAVVDLLVIVVFDLHDLVAGRKGPAKSLDLALARRIQCGLQFDVDGACSDAASVHRAENLDIADWIETERCGMRVLTNSMMRATAVSGSSASTK